MIGATDDPDQTLAQRPRMRLFIAVDLDAAALERMLPLRTALRKALLQAGWRASLPEVERLHLTLKFLGSVEADRLNGLVDALSVLQQTERFQIVLSGLGAFPSISRPSVLWLGVEEGAGELKTLAEQVDRCCQAAGFEPEQRDFTPHLTLARVKRSRGSGRSVLQSVSPTSVGSSSVSEVTLYRSHLGGGGSAYTPLARIPLGP